MTVIFRRLLKRFLRILFCVRKLVKEQKELKSLISDLKTSKNSSERNCDEDLSSSVATCNFIEKELHHSYFPMS